MIACKQRDFLRDCWSIVRLHTVEARRVYPWCTRSWLWDETRNVQATSRCHRRSSWLMSVWTHKHQSLSAASALRCRCWTLSLIKLSYCKILNMHHQCVELNTLCTAASLITEIRPNCCSGWDGLSTLLCTPLLLCVVGLPMHRSCLTSASIYSHPQCSDS